VKSFRRICLLPSTICALALVAMAAPAGAQTLDYSVQTSTTDGRSIVPRLAWSTTPAAQSCTASGATDWTGTKAASGTVTLAAITATRSYTISCTWPGDTSATISWTAPTTNTDGSALAKCASQTEVGSCLRSYLVARGSNSSNVGSDSRAVADRNATSYTWTGLSVGTHWFAVVALNGNDIMSAQSTPPVSKVITAGSTQTRTLEVAVRFPSAPGGVGVQ
jgi:hypothetical protein